MARGAPSLRRFALVAALELECRLGLTGNRHDKWTERDLARGESAPEFRGGGRRGAGSRPQKLAGGARARRIGRRLRRHRHEPALHGARSIRRLRTHSADPRARDRRNFGHLLGADDRRLAEVRDADPARRQPRRRRHHGAVRPRHQRRRQQAADPSRDHRRRIVRCGAFLRRRRDHAGDLGAERDRGARDRTPRRSSTSSFP